MCIKRVSILSLLSSPATVEASNGWTFQHMHLLHLYWYTYIYIYLKKILDIFILMYTEINMWISVYAYVLQTHVSSHLYWYIYIYMCLFWNILRCVHMHVYWNKHICIYVYTYVHICIYVYTYVLSTHTPLYMYINTCIQRVCIPSVFSSSATPQLSNAYFSRTCIDIYMFLCLQKYSYRMCIFVYVYRFNQLTPDRIHHKANLLQVGEDSKNALSL